MTIAGFPDAENAGQVAALFHLDECHRKKAADNLIDRAIFAVTKDGGHIDWWVRRGLFRRIEYRQHLNGESEVSLLRIRFEHRPLLIALLLLGQLATIYSIGRWNEAADSAQRKETQTLMERANDEDVRKGAEKFQELLKQREYRADEQHGE